MLSFPLILYDILLFHLRNPLKLMAMLGFMLFRAKDPAHHREFAVATGAMSVIYHEDSQALLVFVSKFRNIFSAFSCNEYIRFLLKS